ncbi:MULTISPECIES: RelA/SpoT family protein [Carboxydothermus]|uniref:GTP diphosphokinase n=2 Tax=Carboxydothermus TaxID=129957 RepID=Q3A9Z8_CARHZ|nr:GTP pyrophosphokinase [Carboxydothermus hydrogenoformans Z-2901]NYE58017.1 GTP pyrophosphokinase [Carboxydothermus ferrireducens DSM 11255]
MLSLEALLKKIKNYNNNMDEELIKKAYNFAAEAHAGQKRASGEDYITHPLAVAFILAGLQMDDETIAAGLLHDVVEDTAYTIEDIAREFGEEVANLVDGVTKLSRIEFKNKEEQQVENLRKMFLAMAKDIRVILIKLADRLHNMRTLKYHNPEKQKEIARETLEIFAPLAHRLGIYRIKWELEDLAFRYLDPDNYYDIVEKIAKTRAKREQYIQQVISILEEKLKSYNIKAKIEGRPKHLYSIFQKMREQQKDFSEVYDVMAVRVIVESVRDCYTVLGIIHTMWIPVPGRFKDYIAMPKSNMYQSLHTTVIGPFGEPLEIQIRTFEMHRTAEYGIAAHWRYKEGGKGDKKFDEKLSWLRQILEWQRELKDAREFMETLKVDIFSDSVFVFTPKGDVVELPAGSVPIDFAYRIHTDVGNRCVGAKVNGRLVPLDYQLKNGDIVEIITKQGAAPSRDWLKIVKTSHAKGKIKSYFKKTQREELALRGRELIEKEIKKLGLNPEEYSLEKISEVVKKLNFHSLEDLFAAVGDGTVTPNTVLNKIREGLPRTEKSIEERVIKESKATLNKPTRGLVVRGEADLMVRLAQCCMPVPGDPIVGYVTRGRGVSVHHTNCRNVEYFRRHEPERLVEVNWEGAIELPFTVRLEIRGHDRAGFLNDILGVLAEQKISANYVSGRSTKNGGAVVDLALEVKNINQLKQITDKLEKVRGVTEVYRVNK